MKRSGSRRRGVIILGVVMADLAFNLCLVAMVDDFQENQRLTNALNEARAELTQLQEEIRQASIEEPAGEGTPRDAPVGEILVDAELRVSFRGTAIGSLDAGAIAVIDRLRRDLDALPPGRLRLRLDRRLPIEVYATLWPAVGDRELTLAVE